MLATDEDIKAKREADRADNPKPDSSWPKPSDDPLTKSIQRLSARVTSLELEVAKKPKPKYIPPEERSKGLNKSAKNGGAKPRWKACGMALSSIWALFIFMGGPHRMGYISRYMDDDYYGRIRLTDYTAFEVWSGEILYSFLMGVVVSFIVAWVFVKKRD